MSSAAGQDTAAGDYIKWMCGAGGRAGGAMANLHRGVGSLVRDIGEPCLNPSPVKGSKMLKPEKWHTCFDSDGKVIGFRKALKFIVLGGVDPTIRAEVWEFLLGCYALSSTSEYRRKLRAVRREKYQYLVRQCQSMHPSIGTGELAYAVGSKLMDVRTMSKETHNGEVSTSHEASQNTAGDSLEDSKLNYGCGGTPQSQKRKSCSKSAELVGYVHNDTSLYDSSNFIMSSTEVNSCSKDSRDYNDMGEPRYDTETFDDYPSLPVTNLFSNGGVGSNGVDKNRCSFSVPEDRLRHRDERMHSFQINNNIDLVIESNSCSSDVFRASNSDSAIFHSDAYKQDRWLDDNCYNREIIDSLRISDAPEADFADGTKSNSLVDSKDRVSEWLWTLHRIVVDVVRTDSHLDFYGESRNMARMSDILAVYAWVDPSTGYCQGMSDLLSPFVVLYEDDADAFWCFEMLLRRMRENFQMEGPTGVMKQLQALWKIMETTDVELFEHLSAIGAESLHFAFRMLLVLFRRELSFEESLSMWEMMWAADFDEDVILHLEENCLEPLLVDMRNDLSCISCEVKEEHRMNSYARRKSKSRKPYDKNGEMRCNLPVKPNTRNPLCGLSGATIWARHQQMSHISTNVFSKNGDDDLPIFCVAAILVINRHKIIRETHSIDDAIKMFNDNVLKINVKRCVRMALKLRKKYIYKLLKGSSEYEKGETGVQESPWRTKS
uniref:Rab-GAP TBC domain-containing protein n=1 Tax=Leersia perrieri TaxID=77586 RepID=A0A0D9UVP6_9ORYZ